MEFFCQTTHFQLSQRSLETVIEQESVLPTPTIRKEFMLRCLQNKHIMVGHWTICAMTLSPLATVSLSADINSVAHLLPYKHHLNFSPPCLRGNKGVERLIPGNRRDEAQTALM